MNFKTWIISTAFLAAVGLVFSVVPSFADDDLEFHGYLRQSTCTRDDGSRPGDKVNMSSMHMGTNLPGVGRIGNECDRSLSFYWHKWFIKPREDGGPAWKGIIGVDMWSPVAADPWDPEDSGRTDDLRLDAANIEAHNIFAKKEVIRIGMHGTKQGPKGGDDHLHDFFYYDVGGDGVSYEREIDAGTFEFVYFRQGGGECWTGATCSITDKGDWQGGLSGTYYGFRFLDIKPTDGVKIGLRYGMGSNPGGKALKISEGWTEWPNYDYEAVSGNILTGTVAFQTGTVGHTVLIEQRSGILASTNKNPVPGVATPHLTTDVNDQLKSRYDWNIGTKIAGLDVMAAYMMEIQDNGSDDDPVTNWSTLVGRVYYHHSKILSTVFELGTETTEQDAWDGDSVTNTKITVAPRLAADPGWGPSPWVRPIIRAALSSFTSTDTRKDDDQTDSYTLWSLQGEVWF